MPLLTTLRPIALIALLSCLASAEPPSLFDALRWRFIGPFRGGRVLAVTGVPGDERTFYFGSVGGGVWKTTNGGTVWTPIFDAQNIASIGAIAVAPSQPAVVYVGTGEADMRSDISVGNGVYKSTDAGKTWKNIGLRDSQQIARIVVHPTNPDIVYVAALGHAYAPNNERGVFRSTDGGLNWTKVLDKGPEIGAVDLAFEPENPLVIYATMWRSRRPPWSQYGPLESAGSGLYKSTDGGDHWIPLTGNGLPSGDWGRSGVTVARGSHGQHVYAIIDAKTGGGLYRSDDAAKNWTRVSADPRIVSRGWYFGEVDVDPRNSDIVYLPNVATYRSADGGKTFEVLKGEPGGDDYHSLWIDPTNAGRMILGSDQGVNISVDGGKTWTPWYNQPTAQIYHVITDNQFPYWVYGSQQDSGTVAVPSRSDRGNINEYDRRGVGGAESGYVAPDPKDPNIFYVGNTNGSLARFDKRTSQSQNITPWPEREFGIEINQRKYRFPWTAPLIFSPLEPGTLFYGSQVLLKTVNGGLNWTEISPDLTGAEAKGKQAASDSPVTVENAKSRGYGVIYAIAPSPLNTALIWAGTDTGLIHITRTGGRQWSNVTPNGLTDWSKIAQIEASHFDPAAAYAAVDRHRLDDYRPHIFRTRDYGKSWTEIVSGIDAPAFVNAVREDPTRRGLLYAATEMGVYVSFDDGDRWQSLQLNLPVTSVRDLVVHGTDLAIATHGRGFWILDNVAPLRQAGDKVASSSVWLYKPSTAIRTSSDSFQGTPFPLETPHADNPPSGAMIDYFLQSATGEEVTLEILDAGGKLVRRFSTKDPERGRRTGLAIADIWIVPPRRLTAKTGMNRFLWDLHYAPPESVGGGRGGGGGGAGTAGPFVLPGLYQVRLTAMGHTLTQPLKVTLDPRSNATVLDLTTQLDLGKKAAEQMRRSVELAREVRSASGLPAPEVEKMLNGGPSGRGILTANRDFAVVLGVVNSADRKPPAQAYALFQEALRDLNARAAEWAALKSGLPGVTHGNERK